MARCDVKKPGKSVVSVKMVSVLVIEKPTHLALNNKTIYSFT